MLCRTVSAHPRRRISGHKSSAGRAHRSARRQTSQRNGRRRRRTIDLCVAGRRIYKHLRISETISRGGGFTNLKPTIARRPRYSVWRTLRSRATAAVSKDADRRSDGRTISSRRLFPAPMSSSNRHLSPRGFWNFATTARRSKRSP